MREFTFDSRNGELRSHFLVQSNLGSKPNMILFMPFPREVIVFLGVVGKMSTEDAEKVVSCCSCY
nr:hypothetical protein Q903MT_gene1817 [Picea sitchensis]